VRDIEKIEFHDLEQLNKILDEALNPKRHSQTITEILELLERIVGLWSQDPDRMESLLQSVKEFVQHIVGRGGVPPEDIVNSGHMEKKQCIIYNRDAGLLCYLEYKSNADSFQDSCLHFSIEGEQPGGFPVTNFSSKKSKPWSEIHKLLEDEAFTFSAEIRGDILILKSDIQENEIEFTVSKENYARSWFEMMGSVRKE
jgi:hypothetical protein